VHCQSALSVHSQRAGASRLPWLSGTASWSYFAATQYILGIQPDYDGLRLDPCLPPAWPEITVRRRWRGCWFSIHIRNGSHGCGVRRLLLNGKEVTGNQLPFALCAMENRVEVELL
jgi:cellobiose phosphorylase